MAPALALLAMLAGACGRPLPGALDRRTPHEVYADRLRAAGLESTALGHDWLTAAEEALASPRDAAPPIDQSLDVSAGTAAAHGYRLSLTRGRTFEVRLEPTSRPPVPLVFMDLFRLDEGTPRRVASAGPGALSLRHEISRSADYVLRIQAELLRDARFRLHQQAVASLTFPVAGRDARAVGSRFLDPRDGGRRDHHGVDIFAPRDTPVVAAASGWVTSVGTNRLGGNVVWLWDRARRQSQYYAHLSAQAVRPGRWIEAGEVIGFVGNTGNARTTPPHLHFGIYSPGEGAIDPLPFVAGARGPDVAAAPPPAAGAQ